MRYRIRFPKMMRVGGSRKVTSFQIHFNTANAAQSCSAAALQDGVTIAALNQKWNPASVCDAARQPI
jgi:hypothetical protein